jgi:uncharacterized cupin superfamily protein
MTKQLNTYITRAALIAAAWALMSSAAPAEPAAQALVTNKPVKVTAEAAHGPIFDSKTAVKENGPDGATIDVLLARSKDGRVESGLYSAGPSEQDIESYPEDEFMFFLEGSVKLTSTDGSVLEIDAGEGAAIPKGWKGHWSTSGYKKYYVTYASGKAAK